MNRALRSISDRAAEIAICIFFVAGWMALNAALDGPTETDALQASADVSDSLSAQISIAGAGRLPTESHP